MVEEYYRFRIGDKECLLGYGPTKSDGKKLMVIDSTDDCSLSLVPEKDIPEIKREINSRKRKNKKIRLERIAEED